MSNFKHRIVIEYYEPEEGGVCIFPPQHRIDAQVKKLREQEDEYRRTNPPKEGTVEPTRLSDSYKAEIAAARELVGSLMKRREIPFKPFTHGEKLEAKRAATTITFTESGEERFRFDQDQFEMSIVISSTGLSETEVRDLHPTEFEYLVEEIFGRTSINPARLGFFSSSLTN